MSTTVRRLVLVLGDQLDRNSPLLGDFDPGRDRLWMAEVSAEATVVWSHKARIAMFLAAMRQYRDEQRALGRVVEYFELGRHPHASLDQALEVSLRRLRPQSLRVLLPGEWRIREALCKAAARHGLQLEIWSDPHFFVEPAAFADWARGRRQPRMEHFYRWLRQRTGILMDGDRPRGGRWNFDADNRESFGARGPGLLRPPLSFPPDALTRRVLAEVQAQFPGHPGSLDRFDWPLTPAQAEAALADFIEHRLVGFGRYQDAIWVGEPWLYHSRLSAAMNLKLLDPRRVVAAAIAALDAGRAPLAAVEGFVRQIIGWREFVRGLYWLDMPGWLERNALCAEQPLPAFYWTGDTDMACLRDALAQVLRYGYGHHIQRLMVTGLFALLLGVRPREVHAWYLAMYVDAVEWVELPNVLGMSQFADGGRLASKPYVASGRYIERMSNACAGCRFRPGEATGPRACPFTTLYWDFLLRHETRFAAHPRAGLQWRNLGRLDEAKRSAIREQAGALRARLAGGG